MNPLYANLPTTIFETMSARARTTGAINLGQGFPDSGWPEDVVETAAAALVAGKCIVRFMEASAIVISKKARHFCNCPQVRKCF